MSLTHPHQRPRRSVDVARKKKEDDRTALRKETKALKDKLIGKIVVKQHNKDVQEGSEKITSKENIAHLSKLLGEADFHPEITKYFRKRIEALRSTARWRNEKARNKKYINFQGGHSERNPVTRKRKRVDQYLAINSSGVHGSIDLEGLNDTYKSIVNTTTKPAQTTFLTAYRGTFKNLIKLDPIREQQYQQRNKPMLASKKRAIGAIKAMGAIGLGLYALIMTIGDLSKKNKSLSAPTIAALASLGFIFRPESPTVTALKSNDFKKILMRNGIKGTNGVTLAKQAMHLNKKSIKGFNEYAKQVANTKMDKKLDVAILRKLNIPSALSTKLVSMPLEDAKTFIFQLHKIAGSGVKKKAVQKNIFEYIKKLS